MAQDAPDIDGAGAFDRPDVEVQQSRSDEARPDRPQKEAASRDIGGRVEEVVGSVRKRVDEFASDQTQTGARKIDDVASAVHEAADAVAPHMQGAADYIHDAAQNLTKLSSALRQRSIDDVMSDVNRFARAQPVAFFGASVLVGVALTRFLRSSAPASSHSDSGQVLPSDQARMRTAPGTGGVS